MASTVLGFVPGPTPSHLLPTTRVIRLRDAVRRVSMLGCPHLIVHFGERGGGGGKRKERGSRSFPIKPGATTLDEALSFFFFSISRLSYMHRIHGYIHAHKFHDSCRYDSRQPSWRLRDNVKHARTDWGVGSIHRSRRQEKKKKKPAKRRLEKSLVTHVTDLN